MKVNRTFQNFFYCILCEKILPGPGALRLKIRGGRWVTKSFLF
jgi:hypothetical protein